MGTILRVRVRVRVGVGELLIVLEQLELSSGTQKPLMAAAAPERRMVAGQ